jgi:hypothetical protein
MFHIIFLPSNRAARDMINIHGMWMNTISFIQWPSLSLPNAGGEAKRKKPKERKKEALRCCSSKCSTLILLFD